ncbi:MAG: hypothetical protein ACTHL3_04080 [Candidatus Nitrosocosmicus sp.]|jgi:hypothetical protein
MSIKPKIKFSIVTVVVTALVFSMSISMMSSVFAASDTSSTANHFGQAASGCASTKTCPTDGGGGSMGDHAKQFAGEPHVGIGNVGQKDFGCTEKVKPGQLADMLASPSPTCP